MCFHGLLVTAARYIYTFTETQRVRLCAQLALLAERAPGFYLETLFFITVWKLLFMNKVTSRATMMAVVYCLVVRKREMLSPWRGGGVLPLPLSIDVPSFPYGRAKT